MFQASTFVFVLAAAVALASVVTVRTLNDGGGCSQCAIASLPRHYFCRHFELGPEQAQNSSTRIKRKASPMAVAKMPLERITDPHRRLKLVARFSEEIATLSRPLYIIAPEGADATKTLSMWYVHELYEEGTDRGLMQLTKTMQTDHCGLIIAKKVS